MPQPLAQAMKPPAWQGALAGALGIRLTPQVTKFFNAWHQAEGGSASFNPFNTTQPAPGATAYNSNGGNPVKNYPTFQAGINATAQTLKNGHYGSIVNDLQHGAPAVQLARDVAASPWGTGAGVLRVLGAGGGATSSPLSSASASPVFSGAPAGPSPAAQPGSSSPLLGQLLAQTNQLVGLGSNPTLASLLSGPGQAAPHGPHAPAAAPARSLQASTGSVTFLGDTAGEKPQFLSSLAQAVKAVGGSKVRITSGYRSTQHNAAVGGVQGSNHTTGDALDGEVFVNGQWVPIGVALKPVAQRYGLRSGAVPGFFNGRPDPVHVDDGRNVRG